MTVSSTANNIQYAANGVTTSFSFPYLFFADVDLVVTLFDTATNVDVVPVPVLNGGATYDYTISGTFDSDRGEYVAGANVVFNTAPPTGNTVVLVRDVAPTQEVDLLNNTKFPANSVNGGLDKLTVLVQQVIQATDLSLKIPASDPPGAVTTLPPADERANAYLAFDANGDPFAAEAVDLSGTPVSTFIAQNLFPATTAAAARTAIGATNAGLGAFGAIRIQVFTANGTYTPHANMLYCQMEGVGGGGAGGGNPAGAATLGIGGGGGGAGAYALKIASRTDIGISKAVTIGAAGAPGAAVNPGGAGGATSVGALLTAPGGSGGPIGDNVNPAGAGVGGVAGTGDITIPGQDGGQSGLYTNGFGVSGAGGSGRFGAGGHAFITGTSGNGVAGTGKGSGGSGGASYNAAGAGNSGGAGTAGYVVIIEYCSS